jgi:hypothetical protein
MMEPPAQMLGTAPQEPAAHGVKVPNPQLLGIAQIVPPAHTVPPAQIVGIAQMLG